MKEQFEKIMIELLLHIFGGEKILSKKLLKVLPLTSISVDDLQYILPKIKSLHSWEKVWEKAGNEYITRANTAEDSCDAKFFYKKASSMFQFAKKFLNPECERNVRLETKISDTYKKFGKLEKDKFEIVNIKYGDASQISGYFQSPNTNGKVPAVLIVTHLGGIKEELDFMAAYFIKKGFAVLRIELPGSGESLGTLPLNAENICSEAVTYLYNKSNILSDKIISTGISFGAYWTMRTAAIDTRIKLAIGISTPVIIGNHWSKFPKTKWIYLKKCFGKSNIHSTKKIGQQLTLSGIMNKIKCPIVLFHGKKDKLTHPNTMNLLLQDIVSPVYTYIYPKSGYGCKNNLYNEILPTAVEQSRKLLGLC